MPGVDELFPFAEHVVDYNRMMVLSKLAHIERKERILHIADVLLGRLEEAAAAGEEDFDADVVSDIATALGQVSYSAEVLLDLPDPESP